MWRFSLFRRRQVWLPTIWGWLVVVTVTGAAFAVGGRHLYRVLAPNDPAPQARTLVVEGWLKSAELDQAVMVFQNGKYERVVTTGGPIGRRGRPRGIIFTYAERAAGYLKTHGLEGSDVIAVSAPESAQDRTFLSAVKVRDWAAKEGLVLEAIDVFSAGVHGQRSRMLYREAFGAGVDVGVLSAKPKYYDEKWWQTRFGVKAVLKETIGIFWTLCCVRPPLPGYHEDMWDAPSSTTRQ